MAKMTYPKIFGRSTWKKRSKQEKKQKIKVPFATAAHLWKQTTRW